MIKALRRRLKDRRHQILATILASLSVMLLSLPPGFADTFTCTATGAAVFTGSRIHVRCNPASGAIAFFALSAANPDASRVLSLIATATTARRPIVIFFDPSDLSGAAIGCATNNCRLIQAVELLQQ